MGWTGVIIPEEYGGSNFGYLSLGYGAGRNRPHADRLAPAGHRARGRQRPDPRRLGRGRKPGCRRSPRARPSAHWRSRKARTTRRKKPRSPRPSRAAATSRARRRSCSRATAGLFVVSARTSGKAGDKDGITLFAVPADAKGVSRKALKLADSRGAAIVTFENVEVEMADAVLGEADKGYALLEKVLDRARAGLSAEMLGSALQAFDVTLDYLKTRVQFGQVIGSFQALQHRAAKVFADLELARSCVERPWPRSTATARTCRNWCRWRRPRSATRCTWSSNEMVADARRDRLDRRPRRQRLLPEAGPRGRAAPPSAAKPTTATATPGSSGYWRSRPVSLTGSQGARVESRARFPRAGAA